MPHRPFILLPVLSLLLLTLAAGLLARSAWRWDRLTWAGAPRPVGTRHYLTVWSEAGKLRIYWGVPGTTAENTGFTFQSEAAIAAWSWPEALLGFDVNVRFPPWKKVDLPHAGFVALFSVLPLRWLWIGLRPVRGRHGFVVEPASGQGRTDASA